MYRGTTPQYLSELVRRRDDTRLRSSVRGNFVFSRLHVTDKTFSIAGPRAWNALPSDIKLISSRTSFHKKLKTPFQSHQVKLFLVCSMLYCCFFVYSIDIVIYGASEPL